MTSGGRSPSTRKGNANCSMQSQRCNAPRNVATSLKRTNRTMMMTMLLAIAAAVTTSISPLLAENQLADVDEQRAVDRHPESRSPQHQCAENARRKRPRVRKLHTGIARQSG